jgi:TPP-dependent pyruvate/acetoin dehydrogenase alpha subunit
VLLEYRTYRFRGHSLADPELYRLKQEVDRWKERDPIAGFVKRLSGSRIVTKADLARLEEEVRLEIDEAVAFAEQSPWEPLDDLTKHVVKS